MRRLFPWILAALAACGGTQKPAAGITAACPPAEGSAPQETLLGDIPAPAIAAMVVRARFFAPFRSYLDRNPELTKDLGDYLRGQIGVDLTAVEGLVLFATRIGETPEGAVLVCLPAPSAPKRPSAGSYQGVSLYRLDDHGDLIAVVPRGLVLGTAADVKAEIDLAVGRAAPLGATTTLGQLLAGDAQDADLVVAADASAITNSDARSKVIDALGLRSAVVTVGHAGLIRLVLEGNAAKLSAARAGFKAATSGALTGLWKKRNDAVQGSDVADAVAAIAALHVTQQTLAEIEPRVEGDRLVSQYQLPSLSWNEPAVAVVGALALAGVVATRVAPSDDDATIGPQVEEGDATHSAPEEAAVATLFVRATSYYQAHRDEGARFRFPATVAWTPATLCCPSHDGCQPAGPEAFRAPTWKALGLPEGLPAGVQVRFTSEGKGKKARFTVEARSDADCDGTFASRKISASIGADGLLHPDPADAGKAGVVGAFGTAADGE